MQAVRSTLVLEVPIAVGGKLMVDHKVGYDLYHDDDDDYGMTLS